jgi:hypothetical protein
MNQHPFPMPPFPLKASNDDLTQVIILSGIPDYFIIAPFEGYQYHCNMCKTESNKILKRRHCQRLDTYKNHMKKTHAQEFSILMTLSKENLQRHNQQQEPVLPNFASLSITNVPIATDQHSDHSQFTDLTHTEEEEDNDEDNDSTSNYESVIDKITRLQKELKDLKFANRQV